MLKIVLPTVTTVEGFLTSPEIVYMYISLCSFIFSRNGLTLLIVFCNYHYLLIILYKSFHIITFKLWLVHLSLAEHLKVIYRFFVVVLIWIDFSASIN